MVQWLACRHRRREQHGGGAALGMHADQWLWCHMAGSSWLQATLAATPAIAEPPAAQASSTPAAAPSPLLAQLRCAAWQGCDVVMTWQPSKTARGQAGWYTAAAHRGQSWRPGPHTPLAAPAAALTQCAPALPCSVRQRCHLGPRARRGGRSRRLPHRVAGAGRRQLRVPGRRQRHAWQLPIVIRAVCQRHLLRLPVLQP